MTATREPRLNHKGINLIRIVIGSYFLAISLGLITGFDTSVMFKTTMAEGTARLAGTMVLFILAVSYMAGILLRQSCLMLAIFVLSSSICENFIFGQNQGIGPFWRDLVLVCAVLLSYSTLRRSEFRKAALVLRREHAALAGRENGRNVAPRRVSVKGRTPRRSSEEGDPRSMRPVIAPTAPIRRPPPLSLPAPDAPLRLEPYEMPAEGAQDLVAQEEQQSGPSAAGSQAQAISEALGRRDPALAPRPRRGTTLRARKLEIPEPDDDFEENIFLNI
ncbi:MAG: hypothetical protein RIG84_03025 [Roseovarius sp.]